MPRVAARSGLIAPDALMHLFILFVLLLLVTTRAFAGQATLAWNPVTSPSLAGYIVYYGPAAGNYPSKIDVNNTTSSIVSNLVEGATYHFAVTAYDASHTESALSADVSATIPYSLPIANFSASTTSGSAPLAMNFLDASTGNISSYAWNFGDATTSTTKNPSHVYATAGVYTVSLTVTGAGGSNTKTNPNYVTVAAPATAPVAGFSATPTSGTAPLTVNFANASTGSITSYAWNFGDGTTSTLQNPSHAYAAAGVYTVSLTVTGAGGSNTKTNPNYVTVSAPATAPVAGFSATPTSGTAPLTVNFANASTGSITSYAWNFGDGTTSTLQNPSHAYAAAGVYTVSLTVTGAGGSNTKTNPNYVTVSAPATPPPPVGAPMLTGSIVSSSTTVDLTSVGSSDWVQWPGDQRKATGGGQISNRALIGGVAKAYADDPRAMAWRDGSPVATGTSNDGETMSGTGNGFQISAPADTSTRTLTIYLGASSATGTLKAHLSDGSVVDFKASFGGKSRQWDGVCTISYRAASAGQTISVTFTQASSNGPKAARTVSSGISLQGAALAGGGTL